LEKDWAGIEQETKEFLIVWGVSIDDCNELGGHGGVPGVDTWLSCAGLDNSVTEEEIEMGWGVGGIGHVGEGFSVVLGAPIEDCNGVGSGGVLREDTLLSGAILSTPVTGDDIAEEGRDNVTGQTTSSPLDAAWSYNKAVMPRLEGAPWYLDIGTGEACKELL